MSKNPCSVWGWSRSIKYYLTHPWKWVRELGRNIRDAYRRARYGWTWSDTWNMDAHLLYILPSMFRHLADNGCAYPGIKPFETSEKWHDWLHSVADVLESLQEDNWYSQNEYEEDFHAMCEERRMADDTSLNVTVTYRFDDEEAEMIKKLYLERCKELTEQRDKLLIDTFNEIATHFTKLWD